MPQLLKCLRSMSTRPFPIHERPNTIVVGKLTMDLKITNKSGSISSLMLSMIVDTKQDLLLMDTSPLIQLKVCIQMYYHLET